MNKFHNKQIYLIVPLRIYLLLLALVSGCTTQEFRTIDAYVSPSYDFQDVDNILIYSDFALTNQDIGKYIHLNLEKYFKDKGISPHSLMEHEYMREDLAFSEAETRGINYLLVLKNVRQTGGGCRIALYDAKTKTPMLRSFYRMSPIRTGLSINQQYSELVKGIESDLENAQ